MTRPDAQPDHRAVRLAAQLRENLKKRKARARAAVAEDAPPPDGFPSQTPE